MGSWKEFKERIKERPLRPLFLMTGKENYFLDRGEKELIKALVDPAFESLNLVVLREKDFTMEKFRDAVDTFPFMNEHKLVIVKDVPYLSPQKKGGDKNVEGEILQIVKKLPKGIVIAFISPRIDGRKKLVKTLKKLGSYHDFQPLEERELFRFLQGKIQKAGLSVETGTITYLMENLDYLGRNSENTLLYVEQEVNKLISYGITDEVIEKYHVDHIITKSFENDIFQVMDSIEKKAVKDAIHRMNSLIQGGEHPLKILATLQNQMRNVMKVKHLSRQGYTAKAIAKAIGIHPFVAQKSLRQGNQYNEEALMDALNFMMEKETMIKRGEMEDGVALELIVLKLCE